MRETDFFSLRKPRVIAHRGDSGAYPENTMAAFRAACELGAPYVELDVHMTSDRQVVVLHDPDLTRVAGRPGRVAEISYDELADADAGHEFTGPDGDHPYRDKGIRIPLLAEVLATLPTMRIVIEVKQVVPSLVEPMLAAIERARMGRRVLVASEHQAPLDEVRALAPAIPTSFSAAELARFFQAVQTGSAGYVAPADAVEIPLEYRSLRLVTPRSVAAAHQAGAEMHVWTINDETTMRELLALGVDGIFTDFPARLLSLL